MRCDVSGMLAPMGPAAWYAADGNDHWFTWFFVPSPLRKIDSKWKWIHNVFSVAFFGFDVVYRYTLSQTNSLPRENCDWKVHWKVSKTFLVGMGETWQVRTLSVGACIHLPSGKLTIAVENPPLWWYLSVNMGEFPSRYVSWSQRVSMFPGWFGWMWTLCRRSAS